MPPVPAFYNGRKASKRSSTILQARAIDLVGLPGEPTCNPNGIRSPHRSTLREIGFGWTSAAFTAGGERH